MRDLSKYERKGNSIVPADAKGAFKKGLERAFSPMLEKIGDKLGKLDQANEGSKEFGSLDEPRDEYQGWKPTEKIKVDDKHARIFERQWMQMRNQFKTDRKREEYQDRLKHLQRYNPLNRRINTKGNQEAKANKVAKPRIPTQTKLLNKNREQLLGK